VRRSRPRVYRKPVQRRRAVTRSAYYRPSPRVTVRRRKVIRRKKIIVRKRGYSYTPRTRVVVRGVKRYSPAYFKLRSYKTYSLKFNYGRCRNYGYFAYECISQPGYTYKYWDNSMFSLCLKTGYYNTRCVGRAGYVAPVATRTTLRVRSGTYG